MRRTSRGDELQGQGDDVPLEKDGHGLDGRLERLEGDDQRASQGRFRPELDDRLGDDAQRPLRADEKMHEVVAGAALDQFPAQLEDVAGSRDDLEPADIVADDAVFDGPAAPGVRSDHAADEGALLAGVGRKIEPGLVHGLLELEQGDPGFDHRHLVFSVDFEDGVHPFERQNDPPARRHTPAAQAGGPAARRDRNAVLIGQPQDGGGFLRRLGPDDHVGPMPNLAERKLIVGIGVEPIGVDNDLVDADDFFQGRQNGGLD